MSLWDEGLEQFLGDLRNRGVDKGTIDQFLRDKASPEETRKSCQTIQSDAGRKYGAVEVSGQKIPAKWISMIMDNINRFVSITDYAMKGAPETVGLAWFAIKQVLNAVQNNYKLYGFFGSALGDITEMLVIIRTYDKLYDERSNASWKASDVVGELFKQIRLVYQAILDFSFSVRKHLAAGKVSKIGHAIKDAMGTGTTEFEGKMGTIKTLKAKILESAQSAFQQKTFVKFDEVQSALSLVVDGQETSLKMQQAIQQSMEEIARQTKPKSRDDWAKQEFEKNQKKLNPLPSSGPTYTAHLKQKHPGTCDWVFKNERYQSWRNSPKSEILCVDGDHGNGKSILLASITEQLEVDLEDNPSWILQYISCETLQNSTSTDSMYDASVSATRLQHTIVSNLYDLALQRDALLLEKCNSVFQDPKPKRAITGLASHQKAEEHLPDVDDALENLAQLLEKKLFLAIDAVDIMSEAEQQEFAECLQELLKPSGLHVRILVSCHSGCKFFTTMEAIAVPHIAISDFNRSDITTALAAQLKDMPGWSETEQNEALDAILEKSSGSDFKYALQVAIPFLQEPWQRPLSNRLKQLPGGVNETYIQAIGQMAPNYRALLQTSLTWALLANGPITVTEVMDAHLGTYLGDAPDSGGEVEEIKESPLYRQQIRTAGGPFLDCHVTNEQSVLKLKDPASVRRFFLHENEVTPNHINDSKHVCDICQSKMGSPQELEISEKDGHLALAITLVKHLNSSSFQKRYLKKKAVTNIAKDDTKEPQTENKDQANVPADAAQPLTEANLEELNNAASPATVVNGGETKGPEEVAEDAQSKTDTDESLDSVDRSVEMVVSMRGAPDLGADNLVSTRYEIRHWFTHVRKAESLWPKAERDASKDWAMLLKELDMFTGDENLLNTWLNEYLGVQGWTALHIAARFGLISLAEYLLDRGADVMPRWHGIEPIHLAAEELYLDMLSLLLSRGADPNRDPDGQWMSPFHDWILWKATGPVIKTFLDHGASTLSVTKTRKRSVLHFFAMVGSKPEDLYMLLDHVNENGEKADINVMEKDGEAPLHKLLSRNGIPIDLLKAFVERGADVNLDDKDSQRPLYQAAWEGELEAMKVIIDKVTDINDDDIRGRTAMHDAAWQGHTEVLKFLISKGASATRTDKHNRTPFMFACLGKNEETARYLLDTMLEDGTSIENINAKTKRERTPLRQAAAKGFVEIVKLLLDKIDDVAVIDAVDTRKGRNALHCASFRGKHQVVSLLLAKGANVALQDKEGKTALQLCHEGWAIQESKDFEDTIALLISHDPTAAAQDSLLIATAAVNGSKRILEMLHSAKADLDKIDKYGWTPLLLARQYKHLDAEEFLSRQTKPTCWECKVPVVVVSEEGCKLEHQGNLRTSIVANRPISSGLSKYYYEITIQEQEDTSPNAELAIGFCTLSDTSLLSFPGWPQPSAASSKSWAYHGDNGGFYSYVSFEAKCLGREFGPGDVIGCGVDFGTGKIWYTRNGMMIEHGFDKVHGRLFPVVGLSDKVTLVANFGVDLDTRPFLWKDGMDIK